VLVESTMDAEKQTNLETGARENARLDGNCTDDMHSKGRGFCEFNEWSEQVAYSLRWIVRQTFGAWANLVM
jgi:hypothetical protein